ncbi:DUF1292 domain-containing protein [Geosporobacter ferrireducens]|uniref:Uncharacterized protein n=1 Tax=Geosporobacter ferrireducens TaxID=1424294 RepID=A0A1D8GMN3_9FIRM|nr:DUF1292 domain-containing protein [Geosporobacter ferrireducens]AOT72179.1 hypothetical protein Gferi_23130 [Geosporobacter ferrireducens]MTI56069.1 DUF1292 domain-containing protein [Geosporobacter ferrireducens]
MADKQIISFYDEDGQKIEFELVEIIEMEDNKYALLAPIGEEDDAYVYKIVEMDGKEEYVVVEDDDEFERVLEEYDSYFDIE